MIDEHVKSLHDVKADFRDECNIKARNGKYQPAVDKSIEQQLMDLLNKIGPDGWSREAVKDVIINKIPEWSKDLVPFVELIGPKILRRR